MAYLRLTYSTLQRSVGTGFKVTQELLRRSSFRSTLDVTTQAMTPAQHAAQAAVMSLVVSSDALGLPRQSQASQHKRTNKGPQQFLACACQTVLE